MCIRDSAIGIGILGVAANRFAAGRWAKFTGEQPPSTRSVNLKL